jgi:hypothetical protein
MDETRPGEGGNRRSHVSPPVSGGAGLAQILPEKGDGRILQKGDIGAPGP